MAFSFSGDGLASMFQNRPPVQAYAQPQNPPQAASPSYAPNSLQSRFAGIDLNSLGPEGKTFTGSDGKTYRVAPHYTSNTFSGEAGDTTVGDQKLDRYAVGVDGNTGAGMDLYDPDGRYNMHAADNSGGLAGNYLLPLAAAAGGYLAFGGAGAGAAAASGGAGGAVSSPVYGGVAEGTALGGASPGLVGAGGVGAAGAAAGGVGGAAGGGFLSSMGAKAAGSGIGAAIGGMLGGRGGNGNSDLGSIVSGGMDYYNQNRASSNMLDYMRQQQGKIDQIYDPNGPLAHTMYQQMSAQDAAAGRNSQYGPRTTDFLGKFGGDYAKYTANLTQGLAGNYENAFNRQAASGTGLATAVGKGIGSAVGNSLGDSVTQNMSSTVSPAGAMMGNGDHAQWEQGWHSALNGVNNGSGGDYIYG